MSVIVKNISGPIYEARVCFQIRVWVWVWDLAIFEKVRCGFGKERQLKNFKKKLFIFSIYFYD